MRKPGVRTAVGLFAVCLPALLGGCSGASPIAAANSPAATAPTTTSSAPAVATPSPTGSAAPDPVLAGYDGGPDAKGFGQARPGEVFLGGDPTGEVDNVVWDSWGGPQALGTGRGYYPVESVADGRFATARIEAFDLGTCDGRSAYLSLVWWFPGNGESFASEKSRAIKLCADAEPSPTPSATVAQKAHFASPSANIDCLMGPEADGGAYCTVLQQSWAHPPADPGCGGAAFVPGDFALSSAGKVSSGGCRTDIGPECDHTGITCTQLPYGHALQVGDVVCTSEQDGITCATTGSDPHGFRISRAAWSTF